MLFSSQHILFFCLLSLGTLTTLSSNSWFMAWIGLELNLMSFIPLISSKKNQLPSEAALKYFLVQALGSAMIIFSAPLTPYLPIFFASILLALLLKLGAAPFHFWFPAIMEGMNWFQSIILLTIQKIAPMFLITHLIQNSLLFSLILSSAILSALVGSLGGLNQTSLRKILAFSSINHMGWMLTAISFSEPTWTLYFLFYSVISSSVALLFNSQQAFFFSQLIFYNKSNPYFSLINSFSLLSLGGLPPFSGFLPKWILIESMANLSMFFPLSILIFSALVTLYYYIRLSSSSLLLLSSKKKIILPPNKYFLGAPLFISLNLFILFVPSIFLLF